LRFDSQSASIPHAPSIVPTNQLIEFPFDGRMFFANLFELVTRRSLFGSVVLCLKIIFADFARSALVRLGDCLANGHYADLGIMSVC
jgi:hypothetical protein